MTTRTAKVFVNGGSQAVRLPAEYRVDSQEVLIERIGQSLLITPKRRGGWESFFSRPPTAPADFLIDRGDELPQVRDPLF
jgi:antitoxin VapB